MRARRLAVHEEFGLFRVTTEHGTVSAGTLQNALIKAIRQAGIEGVELAPTLEAAEVIESLLGVAKEESEYGTG